MIYWTFVGMLGSLFLLAGVAVGLLRGRAALGRERLESSSSRGTSRRLTRASGSWRSTPRTTRARRGRTSRRPSPCLAQLGRSDEVDDFREAVVEVHKENWRLLQAAAESYLNDPAHFGFIVAGKFHRGQHQGGGRYVATYRAGPGPCRAAPGPGARSGPPRRQPPGRRALRPLARQRLVEQPDVGRVLAAPDPHAARRPARPGGGESTLGHAG